MLQHNNNNGAWHFGKYDGRGSVSWYTKNSWQAKTTTHMLFFNRLVSRPWSAATAAETQAEEVVDGASEQVKAAEAEATRLQAAGQLEEARPFLEEALQAQRASLGDRHPSTLGAMYNLATLLHNMGRLEEVRPLLEEAVQGAVETLGEEHQHTQIFRRSLEAVVVRLQA